MDHYQILIIGGGTAGITLAIQLKRENAALKIGLIEPSEIHHNQPAWTLVGSGAFEFKDTVRKKADHIPEGVDWIKDKATAIDLTQNKVYTTSSGAYTYDYLIPVPGLVMAPELLPGLSESLGKGVVCSNYTDSEHTWEVLQQFKGGNAVFTQPTTPIKSGGAPQKIMYLAETYFRKQGIRDKTNMLFATPEPIISGVPAFAAILMQIIQDRNILFKPFFAPTYINGGTQEIIFKYLKPEVSSYTIPENNHLEEELLGSLEIKIHFDLLHLAPPQMAPKFIQDSALAIQEGPNKGWIEVDIHTMQHKRFSNVFSIGDVVHLPNSKTGAEIRKKAPILVKNLLQLIAQRKSETYSFEGYSSFPLVAD